MDRMLGKYKLHEVKGSGAFGTLWLAEDTWLEKKLALKIPHAKHQDLRKFLSEPKLLAALDHPNIVRLITVDQVGQVLFVVMEFIDGFDLRALLEKESLSLEKVIGITKQILSALDYAHGIGVVHRDLKPTNILITRDGVAKVTDFGTAVEQSSDENGKDALGGTLAYMSKDQLMGKSSPASDVYSVGVLLYEMVTGRLPFTDSVAKALITKIVKDIPISMREINPRIPVQFERVVLRAMAKEPEDRFRSAAEMLSALESLPDEVLLAQLRTPGLDDQSEMPTIDLGSQGGETAETVAKSLTSLWTQGYVYQVTQTYQETGRDDGQFVSPVDLCTDTEGRLFVVDSMRCDVQAFTPDLKFLYKFGRSRRGTANSSEPEFVCPYGIHIDEKGILTIVDSRSCQIQRMDKEGKVKNRFGNFFFLTPGRHEASVKGFNNPRDLAVDKRGKIYVVDTGNHRVAVFSTEGEAQLKFGGKGSRAGNFNTPVSICIDSKRNVLVLDLLNYCVKRFSHGGEYKSSFGKRGVGKDEFERPSRMAIDQDDNIFICDRGRVKVFKPNGEFFTVLEPDPSGGPAMELAGITLAPDGSLYICETRGARIFRMELVQASGPSE